MIVTVEKPLFVLSNGVLVETRPGPGNTDDLPLEDGRALRQLPDLAGRRRLLRLSRQGRRPAGGLLRGQAGRRGDGAAVHGQDAADDRLLQRCDRAALSVRQVRPGLHARVRRRDGEHLGHHDDRHRAARRDRRAGAQCRRPGRPRAGAPVVRRPPDLQGLVAPLAQRGLRLVLRPALRRARPRRGRLPHRDAQRAPGLPRQRPRLPPADRRDRATNRPTTCSTR